MAIDLKRVLGAKLPYSAKSWDLDDVLLYNLAVGAGVPAESPRELAYTYESDLKVIPSFVVQPVFDTMAGLFEIDGLSFNPHLLLHGEQSIDIHRPIPVRAKVTNRGHIAGVYDKGSGALVVVEVTSSNEDGAPLFTNRFSLFLRGEGGFGGESGPPSANITPDREPDVVVRIQTLPQQALLFRLCGDKNPVHADPEIAKLAGFDRPILHGLCSYGMVCKAVVDNIVDGDVDRLLCYQARFSGSVFPGETIVVSMWNEKDRVLVNAHTAERNTPVITNAVALVRKAAA